MYKIFICAGFLSLVLTAPKAQQTDKGLFDEGNTGTLHKGLDEKTPDEPKTGKLSPALLKSLPFSNKVKYQITVTNSHKRRGKLTATTSGIELFSTHYRRNDLHGQWASYYSNGSLLDSGVFANSMPDGEWRTWYANGSLRSIRTYSATKWYAVRSEVARGNSRIFFNSFSRFVSWHSNLFESLTRAIGSFASLAPVKGETYEPPFAYCFHHGLFMNFYHNGAVKDSGYYKDGLRDGLWNESFDNGQLNAAGAYYKGLKDSGWKYYNRKGKLIMLSEYKQGKLIHSKKY